MATGEFGGLYDSRIFRASNTAPSKGKKVLWTKIQDGQGHVDGTYEGHLNDEEQAHDSTGRATFIFFENDIAVKRREKCI